MFEAGGEAVQVSEQSTGESADGLKGRGEGCGTPYLHEHNYARRIPRRMPEPSDRYNWEKQREIFGGELITQLEDPACDVFFGDEAGFEAIPGHAPNGSSAAPVPPRDISAGTCLAGPEKSPTPSCGLPAADPLQSRHPCDAAESAPLQRRQQGPRRPSKRNLTCTPTASKTTFSTTSRRTETTLLNSGSSHPRQSHEWRVCHAPITQQN